MVLAPTEPTPAFVPARQGQCPHAYRMVEQICVHHAYVVDQASLSRALSAYKRGSVPPMLGAPTAPLTPVRQKAPLGPGSLSKTPSGDAGVAQQRRLAELDAMIAAAKEKLRERDEQSRARRVESPSAAVSAPEAPIGPTSAPQLGAASAGQSGGAPDPTQARLSELSQLTSQLPPEQLQAIMAQLSKTGMDGRELERLLHSARTGEEPPP